MNATPPAARYTVLVVDDHPNLAATLARAIAQIGEHVQVIPAENGEKALELVRERTVDVLITDMVMPGITGLDLIEKMKNHPGGSPAYTILITAYDVPGLKETARRMKVSEVLNKPIRVERLCQVVGNAIESLVQGKGQAEAEAAASPEAKPLMSILVADDTPDNIVLMTRYLENEGYRCLSAANGDQALEMVRREMPDLVLLDVNMPGKDGFQALQELRADPAIAHIPVIFITAARLEPMDLQYALTLGADDYITKPFDRRELLARIRTRLRVKETEDILRRRNRELNLLPELGLELSARTDPEEQSSLILRRTVETLGALRGHLLRLNPQGQVSQAQTFSPAPVEGEPAAPQGLDELLKQVRTSRQALLISDAGKDSRWKSAPGDPARTALLAPLNSRSGMLGVLVLVHEQPGYFTLEHKLLLQAITGQAALAMENAMLHSRLAQLEGEAQGAPAQGND